MNIFLILFASLGATVIVTDSFLFAKIRNHFMKYEYVSKLFTCKQCNGFWTGFIFSLLFKETILSAFAIACISSLIGYVFQEITDALGF